MSTTANTNQAQGRAQKQPNILIITVDEMRFPKVFPKGVHTAAEFFQKFMPNTHKLWEGGVKFSGHISAAIACTPSRAVLLTGLYSHQTWTVNTITGLPDSNTTPTPVLNPAFPTYGKLLQAAGYQTPYIGKWHASVEHHDPKNPNPLSPTAQPADALAAYGFQGLTYPDPTGRNLQGTYGDEAEGCVSDAYIANQATAWLTQKQDHDAPWCLTVGFVNPHDQQYFPAGTEFKTFTDLFAAQTSYTQAVDWSTGAACAPAVPWSTNALANPPSYGYDALPPNWESLTQLQENKPGLQTISRQFMGAVWGGVSDDPSNKETFSVVAYPNTMPLYNTASGVGIGLAPFTYWQRSLDVYTQLMELVDAKIGQVVQSIPADVAKNTVIVFTSDHGDYAGAHGLVCGKTGTFYDEAVRVPLIVNDPSGRFTGDVDTVRTDLTSSVDFMPLVVSLAHNGSKDWMRQGDDLEQLYGKRHDMVAMLRSAQAPGREHVLFATDELIGPTFTFSKAPTHLIGMITKQGKVAAYTHWMRGTTDISPNGQQLEYYDYATPRGTLELDNTANTHAALSMYERLINDCVPNELRAPLPESLQAAQKIAHERATLCIALGEAQEIQAMTGSGATGRLTADNIPS